MLTKTPPGLARTPANSGSGIGREATWAAIASRASCINRRRSDWLVTAKSCGRGSSLLSAAAGEPAASLARTTRKHEECVERLIVRVQRKLPLPGHYH